MIYRGTQRVPSAHAVNLAFERLGGSLYASTQVDYGIFSLTLPPESLDEACALFGEVLAQPAFLDIDIEQGIVLEEILEDLDDEGRQVDADNLSRALIYRDHPLGFTITGDEAHVRVVRRGALRRWHQEHYVGRQRRPRVLRRGRRGRRRCAWRSATSAALPARRARDGCAAPARAEEAAPADRRERLEPDRAPRVPARVRRGRTRCRPALDVLMRLVDDGMSTRLYHRLCDARGLCYDVSAGYDGYEDDGVVDFAAGVQHKRARHGDARDPRRCSRSSPATGPTEEELEKARRRIAWDARAMADSAEEAGAFFAAGLLFDRFADAGGARRGAARASRRDDVRAAARELARPERLNVVAVGLLEDGEDERLEDGREGLGRRP